MQPLPPFDDDAPDPLAALREELRDNLPAGVSWKDVVAATTPLTAAENASAKRRLAARRRPRAAFAALTLAAAAALFLAFIPSDTPEQLRAEAERLTERAEVERSTQHYDAAAALYQRALELQERALGPKHVAVALTLTELAELYTHQRRFAQAKPLYERAFEIQPTEVF